MATLLNPIALAVVFVALLCCCADGQSFVDVVVPGLTSGKNGASPSIAVDRDGLAFYVAVENRAFESISALYRCGLNGSLHGVLDSSSCLYTNLSSADNPVASMSVLVDDVGRRLLVLGVDRLGSLVLRVCTLDAQPLCVLRALTALPWTIGLRKVSRPLLDQGKLVVVAGVSTGVAPTGPLHLFRCNPDGSALETLDLVPELWKDELLDPSIAIDTTHGALFVVAASVRNNSRLIGLRCDRNGLNCDHYDLAFGAGPESGNRPVALVDAANARLLVVSEVVSDSLRLTVCAATNLSSCTGATLGTPGLLQFEPVAALDLVNSALVVMTVSVYNLTLVRCRLNGTFAGSDCVVAIVGTAPFNRARTPSLWIDATDATLFAAVDSTGGLGRPWVFRCSLSAGASELPCDSIDASGDTGGDSGYDPFILETPATGNLVIVTTSVANDFRVAVFDCTASGTACTYMTPSTDGPNSGLRASAVWDATASKLIIGSFSSNGNERVSLLLRRCATNDSNCNTLEFAGVDISPERFRPSLIIEPSTGTPLLVVYPNVAKIPVLRRCLISLASCDPPINITTGPPGSGSFPCTLR